MDRDEAIKIFNSLGEYEWDEVKALKVYEADLIKFESHKYISPYDYHLFYLFHDVVFISRVTVLFTRYISPTLIYKRMTDDKLRLRPLVSNEAEYDAEVNRICREFLLDKIDLDKFIFSREARWDRPIYGRKKLKKLSPEEKKNINFKISNQKSEAEFLALAKQLYKQAGIIQPRRREYENPDLVYAIHANLRNNKRMKDIFCDYQKGNLSFYHSNGKITYDNSDSFRRYYNRYKPDKWYKLDR